MDNYSLGQVESRFAELIWDNEPIKSGDLVERCKKELNWKKSTTYTVLRKLCDRKIFINNDGTVSSLIHREEFYSLQSERYLEDNFNGSLPSFVAAFTSRNKLSKKEIEEIMKLIK